jgi:hypothetical protein
MNYAALRAELLTDPLTLGYAGLSDVQASARLNATDTGRTRRRADVASSEIAQAILVADYTALGGNPTAAALSTERRYLAWLALIAAAPTVRLLNDDGSNTPVIDNLMAMFPAGSGTRTRLQALATDTISRADELGLGAVAPGDVALARSKDGGW